MIGEGRAFLAEGTAYAKAQQGGEEGVVVESGVPSGRRAGYEAEQGVWGQAAKGLKASPGFQIYILLPTGRRWRCLLSLSLHQVSALLLELWSRL